MNNRGTFCLPDSAYILVVVLLEDLAVCSVYERVSLFVIPSNRFYTIIERNETEASISSKTRPPPTKQRYDYEGINANPSRTKAVVGVDSNRLQYT